MPIGYPIFRPQCMSEVLIEKKNERVLNLRCVIFSTFCFWNYVMTLALSRSRLLIFFFFIAHTHTFRIFHMFYRRETECRLQIFNVSYPKKLTNFFYNRNSFSLSIIIWSIFKYNLLFTMYFYLYFFSCVLFIVEKNLIIIVYIKIWHTFSRDQTTNNDWISFIFFFS